MNAIMSRSRIAGLAAIAALAAVALPSTAMAGRSHHLKLYKVEKHVDLEGQDDTYNVKCYGTDLALDGMWRVDDVEQDNDYAWTPTTGSSQFDVLRSVRPVEVRNNGDSSYDFRFTPESGGDVSMKLFVTCLGRNAETIGGHTHSWSITPGGTDTVDDTALPGSAYAVSTQCAVNSIVVQPGFEVTNGDADLSTSRPTDKAADTWEWQWETTTPGFTASHYWNCLNLRSSVTNSHRHRIVKQFKTNDPAPPYNSSTSSSPPTVKKNAVAEVQLHCGEHYKGLIGGWHVGFGNPGHGYLWYLGMDPRIKTRAFRFINAHPTNDYRADLYLVCFKDRTT